MEENINLENDLAARYSSMRTPPPTGWRAMAAETEPEKLADGSGTVAGMVYNFNQNYVEGLKSLIQARKFAEAKTYYKGMTDLIEANREGIHKLTTLRGVGTPDANELAARASDVFQYGFDKQEVEMSDGTRATIGQIMGDGSPYLATKARDLTNYGFSGRTADMYLGGDDLQKKVIGGIIDPMIRSSQQINGGSPGRPYPNRDQLVDLADDVSTNWDWLVGTFGEDGVGRVIDYVKNSHATSGNASATMRALTELAGAYRPEGEEMSGADLALRVVNGYRNALSAVMGGDTDKNGNPMPMSDNARRMFDAMAIPAVKEIVKRTGRTFDLNDRRFQSALADIADVNAYLSASGVDMMSDARSTGRNVNDDFGSYAADAMTGITTPTSNIVTQVRRLRALLSENTGGYDAVPGTYRKTGRSSDYSASVDRINGTRSSNPSADAINCEVNQYLLQTIVPHLVGGQRVGDALDLLMSDDNRDKFMSDVTERIGAYFSGDGKEAAAQIMANAVISNFRNGTATNYEDLVVNLLGDPEFGREPTGTERPDVAADMRRQAKARASIARWYYGNVTGKDRFGDLQVKLQEHLMSQGVSDLAARRIVSRVSERAARELAEGRDPTVPFKAPLTTGMMYYPQTDPKTGAITRIHHIPAPMDSVEFAFRHPANPRMTVTNRRGNYSADPADWEQTQMMLQELYKVQQASDLRAAKNEEALQQRERKHEQDVKFADDM